MPFPSGGNESKHTTPHFERFEEPSASKRDAQTGFPSKSSLVRLVRSDSNVLGAYVPPTVAARRAVGIPKRGGTPQELSPLGVPLTAATLFADLLAVDLSARACVCVTTVAIVASVWSVDRRYRFSSFLERGWP